jgi:pimeloyl-ACP methyl ester carboxylesterase
MDYLLIHGTTQSSAGWQQLVEVLWSRGHRAVCLDLPADQPGFGTPEYAALAGAQVDGELVDPVVVAHSTNGMLLPAVGKAVGARHLVWLAAVVPDFIGGRSFLEQVETDEHEIFYPDWSTLTTPPTADPVLATHFLFHDCDLPRLRWALTTLRLFYPQAVYREPPGGRPTVASTYVLPTADRTMTPEWMRTVARRRLGTEPIEIDTGHCPHVSRPVAVADLLETLPVL